MTFSLILESVAGLKKYLSESGKDINDGLFVAVCSGANMNFDRLRFVCERSKIGEGNECLLSVKVEEVPGSYVSLFFKFRFAKVYSKIYPRNLNEVSYRFCDTSEAHLFISFSVTEGKEEMDGVVRSINSSGNMFAMDITENEMAKSHLRFLAGNFDTY